VLPDNCLVDSGLEEYDSSVAWQLCRNTSAAFENAKLRRRSDLQMQHRREPVSMRPVRCLASPDYSWTQTQIYPMSLLGYPHSSSRNGTPTALIWTITEKSRHGPEHQNEPARIPALEQPGTWCIAYTVCSISIVFIPALSFARHRVLLCSFCWFCASRYEVIPGPFQLHIPQNPIFSISNRVTDSQPTRKNYIIHSAITLSSPSITPIPWDRKSWLASR
jgi:hypothetical protein